MNRRRFFGMLGGGLAAIGLGRWGPAEASGYRWIDFGRGKAVGYDALPFPTPLQEGVVPSIGELRVALIARQMREWKETVAYEVLRRGA